MAIGSRKIVLIGRDLKKRMRERDKPNPDIEGLEREKEELERSKAFFNEEVTKCIARHAR